MAHVIVAEGFVDADFIARHTIGFEKYAEHLKRFTPEWAAAETGLAAADIRRLAREYASVKPSMIVVGGASMYKHRHGWEPGRAVATLPALTGQLGLAGGGLGPRHRAFPTGDHLADLTAVDRRAPGPWVPSHMSSIAQLIREGGLDVLLTAGTDMLNSFSDAASIERDLEKGRVLLRARDSPRAARDAGLYGPRARCRPPGSSSRVPPGACADGLSLLLRQWPGAAHAGPRGAPRRDLDPSGRRVTARDRRRAPHRAQQRPRPLRRRGAGDGGRAAGRGLGARRLAGPQRSHERRGLPHSGGERGPGPAHPGRPVGIRGQGRGSTASRLTPAPPSAVTLNF